MLRWRIFKALIKACLTNCLCRSREVVGKRSNKISDESLIFPYKGAYYIISLSVHKDIEQSEQQGGAE